MHPAHTRALEQPPGQDIAGLEIELTNQQSQVTGSVSNGRGEPVKDYAVVVFSRDRERWSYPQTRYVRPAQPDQDGRFKVTGLPAGDYYAIALDYVEPGESTDPEFLDRVKDRAVPFSLSCLALGLLISTRASTRDAASQLVFGTVMPSIFLYTPSEVQ